MQGVTELTECERTKDEWLHEIQEEFRHGTVSMDTYNFLHGLPTRVPGSWVNGDAACGKAACRSLATLSADAERGKMQRKRSSSKSPAESIAEKECDICRAERASRKRVASGPEDPRFRQEKFMAAPAIFANNDVKYDANKTRARAFAAATSALITYAVAKDTPSEEALRE